MSKNKWVNLAITTAMATSVVAVAAPQETEAAPSAKQYVDQLEKMMKTLKPQIDFDARKKLNPKGAVDLPNLKLYNDSVALLKTAEAAVSKTKGKEKTALQARLSNNVKPVITRAANYINAVKLGKKLLVNSNSLNSKLQANTLNATTYAEYVKLTAESKLLGQYINKVYGGSTIKALTSAYSNPVVSKVNVAKFTFDFNTAVNRLDSAIKLQDYSRLKARQTDVQNYIAINNSKKMIGTTTKLYKGLIERYNKSVDEVAQLGTIYVATSKNSTTPTTFGGTASKPLLINGNVTLVAGEDQFIKLDHAVVYGKVTVKGFKKGAGTVTLSNVKVNDTKTTTGQIIVDDVADHSLHLEGVEASELVVNDADGSNIVAQGGTSVNTLVVSENAGASGKTTINSGNEGSFGSVVVNSQGTSTSQGVSLQGDFSKSTVTVSGNNASISVESGATVGNLNVQSSANITAAPGSNVQAISVAPTNSGSEVKLNGSLDKTVVTVGNSNGSISVGKGSTVGEIKKDPSVTGDIKVDNQGSVGKVDGGISVGGNPPVTTNPNPNPNPGPGPVLPSINTPTITYKNKLNVTLPSTFFTTGSNDAKVYSIELGTLPPNTSIHITSVTSENRSEIGNLLGSPIDIANSNVINATDILGVLDSSGDGVSLGALRSLFNGGEVTISGNLTASGYQRTNFSLTIDLGPANNVPSSFENSFVKITKEGNNQAKILINTNISSVELGNLFNGHIDFTKVVTALVTNKLNISGGNANTPEELKEEINALFVLIHNDPALALALIDGMTEKTITVGTSPNTYTIKVDDSKW